MFHLFVHATWLALLFPFAVVALVLHPRSGAMWMARLIWAPFLVYMSRAKVIVQGREHVDPRRPTLYVANHQSSFDIPVLCVSLPVDFRFIAKRSLRWVPLLGWYLILAGHVLIERTQRAQAIASLDKAALKMRRRGVSVLVFPEGTRSPDGRVLPFKKGPFALALKAGVAVCPVTIEGTGRLMPRNSIRIQTGGEIHVTIGAPIDTRAYGPDERERLMRDVRDVIIAQSLTLGGAGGDRDDVVAALGREGVGVPPADRMRSAS